MKRTLIALGTASALAFSASVLAEQQLSPAQMDGITAGGSAAAEAFADAFGVDTYSATNTFAEVLSLGPVAGQVGAIEVIQSTALADAESLADNAAALAGAAGVTEGTLLSDTVSFAQTLADAPNLYAYGAANNTSIASEIVRGRTAYSSSAAFSAATLAD